MCAFFSFRDEAWLTEGVSLVASNTTHTPCLCTHLTNFAVLTNVDSSGTQNAPGSSDDDTTALAVIMCVAHFQSVDMSIWNQSIFPFS